MACECVCVCVSWKTPDFIIMHAEMNSEGNVIKGQTVQSMHLCALSPDKRLMMDRFDIQQWKKSGSVPCTQPTLIMPLASSRLALSYLLFLFLDFSLPVTRSIKLQTFLSICE